MNSATVDDPFLFVKLLIKQDIASFGGLEEQVAVVHVGHEPALIMKGSC
jgi:hypothetical protein